MQPVECLAPQTPGKALVRGTVVLGVTASDSHVVANHMISIYLRGQGFHVVNLGPCTPTEEFMRVAATAPDLVAVLIGSLNGHALDDLADLPRWRADYQIHAPIIVGGNLSVGALKSENVAGKLMALGVDAVIEHPRQILTTLLHLPSQRPTRESLHVR
jgi:methylaspartate mutase sigma subunit